VQEKAAERASRKRQLGLRTGKDFYEVYYTFAPAIPPADPLVCSAPAASALPGGVLKGLDGATLYDVFALHQPLAQSWTPTCGVLDVYSTKSGHYCPHNNIQAYGPSAPASMKAVRCVDICPDPANAACEGYEAEYAATSNALCVTRSECEALCDDVEGCLSFDMHATKPRCFLNSAYCTPGNNPYAGSTAALLGKTDIYEASTDYDFVYKDTGKVKWSTASDESCGAGDGKPDGTPASVAISVEGTKYSCGLKCGPLGAELTVIPSLFPLAAPLNTTYAEYLFGADATPFKADVSAGSVEGDFSFGGSASMLLGDTDTVPGGKVIISVERGILASVGIVDAELDAVYFGVNFRLPFDASLGFTYGDFSKYPPVAVAEREVVFFAEYPGRGVAMVKATVDDVSLELTFGDPTFIKGYKAFGTFLKGAVSVGGDIYLTLVTRATLNDGCFPPSGEAGYNYGFGYGVGYAVPQVKKPMALGVDTATWGDGCAASSASVHTVRALVYSAADDAWTDTVLYEHAPDKADHVFSEYPQGCFFAPPPPEYTTTTSAPPAPDVLNAFTGATQARRLGGHAYYYQNPHAPLDSGADKLNWTLSMIGTDRAIVRTRVVKTDAYVVYALVGAYTDGQVKLLPKPFPAPAAGCGWSEPFLAPMTTCTQLEITAIPGGNKVIVSCASHATGSIVVCDVSTSKCGSLYSLSDGMSSVSPAPRLSAMACATSTLCTVGYFGAKADLFYLAVKDLEISSTVHDPQALPSYYYYAVVGLTAVDAEHFYLGVSANTSGNMTRQASYPHDLTLSSPKDIVGVLISAVGGSWEAFSDPASSKCDYAIAGNALTDTDVCGSRVDCEIACAAYDACVAFEFVPRSYVCTLYSTCSPEATDGSVVVTKAESAKCKAAVEGAILPPSLADTCAYDSDAFSMTSCGLDGEYIQVSDTDSARRRTGRASSRTPRSPASAGCSRRTPPPRSSCRLSPTSPRRPPSWTATLPGPPSAPPTRPSPSLPRPGPARSGTRAARCSAPRRGRARSTRPPPRARCRAVRTAWACRRRAGTAATRWSPRSARRSAPSLRRPRSRTRASSTTSSPRISRRGTRRRRLTPARPARRPAAARRGRRVRRSPARRTRSSATSAPSSARWAARSPTTCRSLSSCPRTGISRTSSGPSRTAPRALPRARPFRASACPPAHACRRSPTRRRRVS
jgi:hypothetical protein